MVTLYNLFFYFMCFHALLFSNQPLVMIIMSSTCLVCFSIFFIIFPFYFHFTVFVFNAINIFGRWILIKNRDSFRLYPTVRLTVTRVKRAFTLYLYRSGAACTGVRIRGIRAVDAVTSSLQNPARQLNVIVISFRSYVSTNVNSKNIIYAQISMPLISVWKIVSSKMIRRKLNANVKSIKNYSQIEEKPP